MKKIRFLTLSKKDLFQYAASIALTVSILYVNILYFSTISPSVSTYFSLLGYNSVSEEYENMDGGKLAIVIDDFGQDRGGVMEMMSIERHLTFAVSPFLTFSQLDAKTAHDKGYEVIMHLPIGLEKRTTNWLGSRFMASSSNNNETLQLILDGFESIPYAVGANIHIAGKTGCDELIIWDILEVIKSKGLYIVDSRNTKSAVTKKIADKIGVPCYENNILLDSTKSKSAIKKQLRKAGHIALQSGKALAIGHVGSNGGKVTAQAIYEMLPEFDKKNIELVFVSELEE